MLKTKLNSCKRNGMKEKYDLKKLYLIALREAISRIALDKDERSYNTVYSEIMKEAKKQYHNKTKQ